MDIRNKKNGENGILDLQKNEECKIEIQDLDYYLPIGSIVSIGDDKQLIIGKSVNKDGISYDYVGMEYPGGFATWEDLKPFNKSNIDNILFEGFSDHANELYNYQLEERRKEVHK